MPEASPFSPSSSGPPGATCDLCGLPAGRANIFLHFEGKSLRFCCLGCRGVYQILANNPKGGHADFRETALYRACLESGIIPRTAADPQNSAVLEAPSAAAAADSLALTLRLEGMWCPACAWLIEETLRRTGGVSKAEVLFFSDLARVSYFPALTSPRAVIEKVSRLGYRASLVSEEKVRAEEKKALLVRLGVSSILTFNIMMMAFALYYGFLEDLTASGVGFLSWPLWAMATLVVFYGGWPILQKGIRSLLRGAPTMEALISVGALSAYGYSFFRMLQGSLHLYFDTAAMIVTLVLVGKYIELLARRKASKGVAELYELTAWKVRISPPVSSTGSIPIAEKRDGGGPKEVPAARSQSDGGTRAMETGERWVPAAEVRAGDFFFVLAGERIPLDGRVVSGNGHVDESFLTGEARPIRKGPEDDVAGGALLVDGFLCLRATRMGKEGSLTRVIDLVQEALSLKNPAEALADRITRWFVPAVFLVAVGAALLLHAGGTPGEEALLRGLTVLLISCPCALGLAAPIGKVAALGAGRRRGILVRDPGALEKIKDLDTWVFDKTGTLTEGSFDLLEICSEEDEKETLKILAAVEISSSHFLAAAVLRKAREAGVEMETAPDFREYEGLGVKGTITGKTVGIGSRSFMAREGLSIPSPLSQKAAHFEESGKTVVFFGWEERSRGFGVFGDRLRPGVPETIRALRARGVATWLVSGDSEATTRRVAREAGIENHRGNASPKDKVELIRKLQAERGRVGMVGDGINDSGALARADVGFAFASGADLAREASDVTFLTPDPSRVLEARGLSLSASGIIRRNFFFAFVYNALAIPLAISGFLNPVVAVCAMFLSSLSVIGNALRIGKTDNRVNAA